MIKTPSKKHPHEQPISPINRYEKLEITYLYIIFILIVLYNIYLDFGDIKQNGSDSDFLMWWIVFLVTIFISTVMVFFKLIKNLHTNDRQKLIWPHTLYVLLIVLSIVFQAEVDYMKRCIQSVYYARSGAPCRKSNLNKEEIEFCYSFISYPQVDIIAISPGKKLDFPREKWGERTIAYLLKTYPVQANAVMDCRPPIIYHFYGDVYYIIAQCS